jgi:UDP-GlcNAc:undecaprenyl-phosphate GlcNAc-1-phosphate transferase
MPAFALPLIAILGAAALAVLAGWAAIAVFLRLGHNAPADPFHDKPVALSGGVAVWIAWILVAGFVVPKNQWTLAILGGGTGMFVVGLIDDIKPFRADVKLLLQLGIAAVMVAMGVEAKVIPWPVVSIPITLLWLVGVTNAVNLIDNMDGLAPGVAGISAGFLGLLALFRGDVGVAMLALPLAGACLGFLKWNLPPARAFLGDAGSLFVGFTLAATAVLSTRHAASGVLLTLALPVLVLWLPIFNTTFVTITRLLLRVPVSTGRPDHINFRLLGHGLSASRSVWTMYGMAAFGGAIAMSFTYLDSAIGLVVGVLGTVAVFFLGVFLFDGDVSSFVKKYDLTEESDIAETVRRSRAIVMLLLDMALISVGWFAAFLIRFEGEIVGFQFENFYQTLPLVLVIQLSCMSLFGLYSTHWRHISMTDLAALTKAVALAAVVQAAVIWLIHVPNFSRSVLVLDGIMMLVLLGGVRASTRLLRTYVQAFRTLVPGQAALVVGAGDAGEIALRMLWGQSKLIHPVGFLDDDPVKRNTRIHGVPVLGTVGEMRDIVDRFAVQNVVIAMPSAPDERVREIVVQARELGLKCYEVWVSSSLNEYGAADAPRRRRNQTDQTVPLLGMGTGKVETSEPAEGDDGPLPGSGVA